jgi:hypothetical protein
VAEFLKHFANKRADLPQWMVRRHPFLRREVGK